MAVNRKFLKFLFALTITIQLLFTLPQNCFSKIYEWKDYSKIFNEETALMCRLNPTHVKVDLPENLKNYENITLVVLIETDPTRIQNRHYLIVNNYDKEKYFLKVNSYYRIKIKPKHLKVGINSL